MSHSETIQYTSSVDVGRGRLQRLLPVGALLIDAYANEYGLVTVNFMGVRRRDTASVPLPSPEECVIGNRPLGFYRYIFRIGTIGSELPPGISWCIPLKINDDRYGPREAQYLFYAIEP